MELAVRNVNDALPAALQMLQQRGARRDTRNGPVLYFTDPVLTRYHMPRERVLFNPARDANPFFHLFESLWMLAGRDDVGFVKRFVKRMAAFSDDGQTLHGAYGRRWRSWFGLDQLHAIIEELKLDPNSRRCVLAMWDGRVDLTRAMTGGKDVPCNTQAFFAVSVDRSLDMTLINRSNDIVWGAYGANAVHFSYLQEYVAAGVGLPVGRFNQFSNNLHGYLDTVGPLIEKGVDQFMPNPYEDIELQPFPLVSTDLKTWNEDLSVFMEHGAVPGLRDPFFRRVAVPMWVAHLAYKSKDLNRFEHAREALANCRAGDWRRACLEWLGRREANAMIQTTETVQ